MGGGEREMVWYWWFGWVGTGSRILWVKLGFAKKHAWYFARSVWKSMEISLKLKKFNVNIPNMMSSLKGGDFPSILPPFRWFKSSWPRCCWELFKAYELGLVRTPGALMITGPPDTDVAAVKIQEAEASYPQDGQKRCRSFEQWKKTPWLFRVIGHDTTLFLLWL